MNIHFNNNLCRLFSNLFLNDLKINVERNEFNSSVIQNENQGNLKNNILDKLLKTSIIINLTFL